MLLIFYNNSVYTLFDFKVSKLLTYFSFSLPLFFEIQEICDIPSKFALNSRKVWSDIPQELIILAGPEITVGRRTLTNIDPI